MTTAAAVSTLPYTNLASSRPLFVEGRPVDDAAPERSVDLQRVTPDYFEALRIPILSGRAFDAGDGADAPLTGLISRRLADDYFRGKGNRSDSASAWPRTGR